MHLNTPPTLDGWLSGLTPELLQKHFPIVRSIRRETSDLFEKWISANEMKDDAKFYAALVSVIIEDIGVIKAFDARMLKKGDRRKTFVARGVGYLMRALGPDVGQDEFSELSGDYFDPGSEERIVHRLCLLLFQSGSDDGEVQVDFDRLQSTTCELDREEDLGNWRLIVQEVIALCQALDAPNPEQVAEISEKVDLLLSACRVAAEAEVSVAKRRARIDALIPRFSSLGLTEIAPSCLDAMSDSALNVLERNISTAEIARDELLNGQAKELELKRQKEAADDAEDYETLESLIPKLKEARAEVQAAKDALENAVSACRDSLAAHEPEIAEGEVVHSGPAQAIQNVVEQDPVDADAETLRAESATTPDITPIFDGEDDSPVSEHEMDELLEIGKNRDSQAAQGRPEPVAIQPTEFEVDEGTAARARSVESPIITERSPSNAEAQSGPDVDTESAACSSIDLNERLADYLSKNEPALAYHLATLMEERGEVPGVPPALLKALVRSGSITHPEEIADPRNQGILADAMDALAVAEQGGCDLNAEYARIVAFAALLRPALFDFNRSARTHMGRLSMVGQLQAFAPVAAALTGLGYDVQLTVEDLAELRGRDRQRLAPGAIKELRSWLETNRTARTCHKPTYMILHKLLAPAGEIGSVVEAALRGDAVASVRARELIAHLADPERFVAEMEVASGRPRRDRIEGLALSWITGRLTEGRSAIEVWLSASTSDSLVNDDRRRETLRPHVGALMKACDSVLDGGELNALGLPGAIHAVLKRAFADFTSLLRGETGASDRHGAGDPLRTELLRLPAICLPHWRDSAAFDEERTLQRSRLFQCLSHPERIASDLRSAFSARLQERATAAAIEILDQLERANEADPSLPRMRQELKETIEAARKHAYARVQRLRQDLATLLNLDLNSGEEVRQRLDRLDAIYSALSTNVGDNPRIPLFEAMRDYAVPPDFPELEVLLQQFDLFCDELRNRIRLDQLERLEQLSDQQESAEAARTLIARAPSLDPVTLDDMIADIQAGRDPLSRDENPTDTFSAFYPVFVDALAKERDLNIGRIISAASQGAILGPLDFRHLDRTATDRAKALLENWVQVCEAVRNKRAERLQTSVQKLLGIIGFTSVKIEVDKILIQGRLYGLRLSCDAPKPGRWFLPPEFGSLAKGSYRVLVASADVEPTQVAKEVGDAPDRPWIVLHFGRLDLKGREKLATSMRQDRRAALTLDEALLLHLATAGGDPLERLFVCGMPFALIQPYTTNPRNIPPEIFFGRRDEIARITDRSSGGSLIYGGRQLGKSALLNHIRRNLHQPSKGQLALYDDIGDVGDEPIPTSAIWSRIADKLEQESGPSVKQRDAESVLAAIRSWLAAMPERRILLMLDEADHFLAGEHPGYLNLRRMKDLMEATEWRFKVVFAGLHNVRRLAQAPNSPLVHLGEPICVGPMNTTADNRRELRALVTQPIQATGFVYDPPELAADILARVNHYPSLVQVFCKEVLAAASSNSRSLGPGPRWKLGREMLFEGGLASRIAGEIRKRFQWTLDLDPRYDLIAKCLALYRFDHENGHTAVLRDGFSAEEIYRLVEPWWPISLERISTGDFRALLDEMVDLGVLGSKGAGHYRLRNAQVAQLMGQRDTIEEEILALSEKESKADYDAATYHRRSDPSDPDSLSPLSDRQLEKLFARGEGGIRLVMAAPALWGAKVGARLAALASGWEDETGRHFQVAHIRGKQSELRDLVEAHRSVSLVIVLDCPWNKATCDWLMKRPEVCDGRIRPIWVIGQTEIMQAMGDATGAMLFVPPLLGDNMVRHWLRSIGLTKFDDGEMRNVILAASGGLATRLAAMRPLLAELGEGKSVDRGKRIAEWSREHPINHEDLGMEQRAIEVFREVGHLLDDPEALEKGLDRRILIDLIPSADTFLPSFAEMDLVEVFSDGRCRLTHLGRLLVR